MKKTFFSLVILISAFIGHAQVAVKNLLCENLKNPISIDVTQPRFSWQLIGDKRNIMQTAYELKITDAAGKKVWNSGRVTTDQSVFVPYNGPALQSGKRYNWQVQVWDNENKTTGWSEPAFFEMGLLRPEDWKAKWIEVGYAEDSVLRPSPLFRKTVALNKKIKSAKVYITSHGLYEAFINGKRIGKDYLTPGWTSYNKRLQYQTYDVTDLLQQGNNAIGAQLGSGWYRGSLAWENNRNIYGKSLALLLQLEVDYTDGSHQTIITDESWKSSTGAVRYSEIYHGEIQDPRSDKQGWSTAQCKDSDWSDVQIKDHPKNILIATYNEPIRKHETFKPIKTITTPKGEKVLDFGQNLVGWVQVKLKGSAGDSIKIYHAEVLDKEGNFYTDNLRAARQQNIYVLKGSEPQTFHPHFTFQGFRYVKIEGIKGELNPADFTAVALYSDMQPTGSFTSSNKLINQLQHNIQWGQKGNFLDVPTDCPQRDERLGWTGDAQVFGRTAAFNMNVHNFFTKWLKDVAADQLENGIVPPVIPNVLSANVAGSAGWADASVIIPWDMYQAYGDTSFLSQQYRSMKAWVDYMKNSSTAYLWNKGFHYGDWLFYRPFDDNDGRAAVTDKYLIAQCFFANSTQVLINTAKILGKDEDARTYTDLLKNIKDAFYKEYVTPNGRLVSGTQTAYVLALNFDMLPDSLRESAAKRLVENVASYGDHLTTGFLGTPYLCHVLTRFGYRDVAYKLLMQETYPSWLYPVKMGATTIWERWDGQKPDSTFQTPGMNSFNHYAYGAIGDWMYRVVAGINDDPDAPGYKKIRIQPHIGGGLNEASASYFTNYGFVSSHWKVADNEIRLNVEIPANTTAIVLIPTSDEASVKEGGRELSSKKAGSEKGYVAVEVGSGKYAFTARK